MRSHAVPSRHGPHCDPHLFRPRRRRRTPDTSGEIIERRCLEGGHSVVERVVVADEEDDITERLLGWSESGTVDVVITTGGTGLTPRDVTPEATRRIAEREVPGIATALALEGLKHTPYAALTRGLAVTRRKR